MARIRTLKPDIWQDEALGRVPVGARLLYIGIITQADDEGRLRAAAPLLRSAIFPYDARVTVAMIEDWLDALQSAGLVRLYTVRFEGYADLPTWGKHQRISHPGPSQLPAFENRNKFERTPPLAGDSVNAPEDSRRAPEHVYREGKGRDKEEHLSPWPGDDGSVWSEYTSFHPSAHPTERRRQLLHRRRKEGISQETLVAAIHGNHHDPWCNGENPSGKTYHGWELIFRDAGQVEKYAATAPVNGQKRIDVHEAVKAAREAGFLA